MQTNILFFSGLILILNACGTYTKTNFRAVYYDELDLLKVKSARDSIYLKAHDYDGSVYIFQDEWLLDTAKHLISGKGKHFSAQRRLLQHGDLVISTDDIVLYETNKTLTDGANAFLGPKLLISIGNVFLAGICVSVPKACFGSCPTFYTENTDNVFETKAEAFSSAISPGMEYTDIDDLQHIADGCGPFSLFMKNEALETHLVNHARLLAFPLTEDIKYILHATDNTFHKVNQEKSPESVYGILAPRAECLTEKDNKEWTSMADPEKLASKEELILEFDTEDMHLNENIGLKLTFRQTLMTTYMLYHAISYMGDEYSDFLAKMEVSGIAGYKISRSFMKVFGEIEIYTRNYEGNWIFQGSFYETGPIAKNTQLCIFSNKSIQSENGKIHVKLVYNKGLWRFDEAKLVSLSIPVQPSVLMPFFVSKNKIPDNTSLNHLTKPEKHLVSMPGDLFEIHYQIPCEDLQYQLFLDSRGYYLEWMRSNWLNDKNIKKLRQMLRDPAEWLNTEAPRYKMYEHQMEADFIESRIHNENKKLLQSLTARAIDR